eukprot:GHVN01064246.1.p1 GENE.GHVN01064246.1~~GHVN01064246.1.p1  ORF type:complete len:979 (-),score=249.87 GHVN01064246.1:175-3111(-)
MLDDPPEEVTRCTVEAPRLPYHAYSNQTIKLAFSIAYSSGDDPDFPSHELTSQSSRGWQSARYCEYPQELVLEMHSPSHLTHIKLLSHQSNIASKIELYSANGPAGAYHASGQHSGQLRFKRLGCISLDDNEKSQHQSREVKSVFLDAEGRYLKLVLFKNHPNIHNPLNQVGIVGLRVWGVPLAPQTPQKSPTSLTTETLNAGSHEDGENKPGKPKYEPMAWRIKSPTRGLGLTPPNNHDQAGLFSAGLNRGARGGDRRTLFGHPTTAQFSGPLTPNSTTSLNSPSVSPQSISPQSPHSARHRVELSHEDTPVGGAGMAAAGLMGDGGGGEVAVEGVGGFGTTPRTGRTPSPSPSSGDFPLSSLLNDQLDEPVSAAVMAERFDALRSAKQQAVFNEDYEEAKRLKHEIESLVSIGEQLAKLEEAKRRAVAREDYDTAKKLKQEVERLKQMSAGGLSVSPTAPHREGDEEEGKEEEKQEEEEIPIDPIEQPLPGEKDTPKVSTPKKQEKETFPIGQHPLQGVPNLSELPQAEPVEEIKTPLDSDSMREVLHQYHRRALVSKQWVLREAGVRKIALDLSTHHLPSRQSQQRSVFNVCVEILTKAASDKIAAVFIASQELLERLLMDVVPSLKMADVISGLECYCLVLSERMMDSNAKVSQAAYSMIISIAETIGGAVAAKPLFSVPKKTIPKSLVTRLGLLKQLVDGRMIKGYSKQGFEVEECITVVRLLMSHASHEVRKACAEVVGAIYMAMGYETIQPFLDSLKGPQLDLFEEEIASLDSSGPPQPPSPKQKPKKIKPKPMTPAQHDLGDGDDEVIAGDGEANEAGDEVEENGEWGGQKSSATDQPDPVCDFCGLTSSHFTDPIQLDMHWLRHCAMLTLCKECDHVIELSQVPDHLLDECTKRGDEGDDNSFAECDRCHQAVKIADFQEHITTPQCKLTTPPEVLCPLCFTLLPSTHLKIWQQHADVCKSNPRAKGGT